MSAIFVFWRPWRARTRVAAETRSARVRCLRRSKRLPLAPLSELTFMTEYRFRYTHETSHVNPDRDRNQKDSWATGVGAPSMAERMQASAMATERAPSSGLTGGRSQSRTSLAKARATSRTVG